MEVKILCSCGTKYAFDVEPVEGKMPGTIQCPQCGTDGTASANAYLQSQLPPTPAEPKKGLSVARIHVQTPSSTADNPSDGENVVTPPPATGRPYASPIPSANTSKRRQREYGEPNMTYGLVAAVVTAFVLMLLYAGFIRMTHVNLYIISILIGFCIGFAARLASGGYSQALGWVCALSTVVAVIGANYSGVKSIALDDFGDELDEYYNEAIEDSKKAIAASEGGDDAIRVYLAEWLSDPELEVTYTPQEISEEMLTDFKDSLPERKKLASGETTLEDFKKQFDDLFDAEVAADPSSGIGMVFDGLGFRGLLWLIGGVTLAFRFGTGEAENLA